MGSNRSNVAFFLSRIKTNLSRKKWFLLLNLRGPPAGSVIGPSNLAQCHIVQNASTTGGISEAYQKRQQGDDSPCRVPPPPAAA